ncbi:MAG: prephenate dehydrogenase/arogenate dehydrogenase family protein [Solirubrobacterales bacterium]
MRIAVLGVGLIGGSVGLAARLRLGAEVAGFDPDADNLARARAVEALDIAAGSVAEAVAGAQVVFCAAPVAALPRLVDEAIRTSGPEAVVTDVGSTKRALVASLAEGPARERFIGGHPLAGAETSGVANARADLFEGARWYLTPTDRSGGVQYDLLQRTVADLGARPQAIEAAAHDRLMATVSHLPHVIANVLVQQAAAALAEESERLPEVGPSFRDTTRVAGANPAIWEDIYAANSDAVADAIDAAVDRLADAGRRIRAGEGAAVGEWHRAAGTDRRRLLEAEIEGGELIELRIAVENRPGTVAEIALALGHERVNIEDMALYPAADLRTGAITLWIAGEPEAERAAAIVRGLGHGVSVVGGEG